MNTEKLFGTEKTGATPFAPVKSLARFIVAILMMTFGALAVHAASPHMSLPAIATVLENGSGTVNITLSDAATNATVAGITITATSSDTNLVTDADVAVGGTGASRTLTITPEADQFGAATITVVATDAQPVSVTNTFTLHVSLVNQGPSNTLSASVVTAAEESAAQTVTGFVTDMVAGPASQASETWTFSAKTASGDPTNAVFTALPLVATNGTLTFHPKAHSYGTNLVTLIMKNNGGTANSGINTFTNTFTIEIAQTFHAPTFLKVGNVSIMENTTNPVTVNVTNWDYDINSTNFSASSFFLTATSSDTNLETVTVSTNASASHATNVVFVLTLTPATNGYGVVTNTLVATEAGLSTTNTFKLTIGHVNQAPSFTFDTNVLISNIYSSVEETLTVTEAGFLTNLLAGPTNAGETNQTWKFTLTTAKGATTNALFTKQPAIASNGTLTYSPKAHSYGTNLVTVVMIDNGGTAHGGIDSYSNTFMIGVAATNHPPGFLKIANQTMLENQTNTPVSVTLWDFDQNITNFNPTNFVLTATSSNTNYETLVVSTNIGTNKLTNAVFSVSMVPGTNQFGVVTNTLVCTEGGFSTTNTFKLTITHVNQAPSFAYNTNVVVSNMFTTWEENLSVTSTGFLTNLAGGPTNENTQTWAFTVTTATGATTNALFTKAPAIDTTGTLTYQPKAHSYGTNLVTIVMKDNGGTANHGVDVYTNTFLLAIERTNHVPNFFTVSNVTVLENVSNTTTQIKLWDFDQNTTNFNATNFSLTATSGNTALATVAVSTNITTNSLTNAVFTLTLTPLTNQFGNVTNTLVATEDGLSATNTLVFEITHVNQQPKFAFNTNVLVTNVFSSEEETLAVTNAGFVTNITTGPTNESSQTWTFTLTTVTNTTSNAQFTIFPAIATNGTLTYFPKAHSYGTNLVTVVMTDNGGVLNGGVAAYTNTFSIAVVRTNHAPGFQSITNVTVLENLTNTTTQVRLWDYDQNTTNFAATNFSLTASTGNTNWAAITVSTNIGTNALTNAVFTLTLTPATNQFGSVTNTLVGTEAGLSTTNTLVLTITHVNQAPSYTFDTDVMTTNVLAIAENAGPTNIIGFLTNQLAGPTNESTQTWTNTAIYVMTNSTNAHFTQFTIATNGTLSLTASTNSFGTNTVQVVMTDNGGTANGGVNSYTNTFQLQVAQVWYPPEFTGVTNKTILENANTNLTATFSLYNHLDTNFSVVATSSDSNVVAVTSSLSGSNCTLTFAPVTNQNGTNTITITAVADSLTNSTNLTLTITPVTQPPSFTLLTNTSTVDQYDVAVTLTDVITNVSVGPTNQSAYSVGFIVTNSSSNLFVSEPVVTMDSTNTATLSFEPNVSGGTVTVGIRATNSGSTANGGVNMSPVQTFTITIPANTFTGVTGTYAGLFYNTTTIDNPSSGFLTFNLTGSGTFAGYFVNASASNSFSGQFDISNYSATATASPYTFDLTIDTSTNQAVAGTVTNTSASWGSTVQAYRQGFSTQATPLAGNYTMAFQGLDDPTVGPPGDSLFDVNISTYGFVTLSGTMADGTAVAVPTVQISAEGYYPLYVQLYSGGALGSLVGWLDFTNSGVTTNSALSWFNLAGASTDYPAGYTNQASPIASPFNSATHLTLTNAVVVLTGGNLLTNLTNDVTVSGGVITAPTNNGLSLTIDDTTGVITGHFVDPNSDATDTITGTVLQNNNINPGYFLGTSPTNQNGGFILIGN